MRIGSGYDIHVLVPGRPLMLGGIRIPSDKGEMAHSDGDVLIHALIDAILGAYAKGDIGSHFPPSDVRWKDADSRTLLSMVLDECRPAFSNIDCTVFLEKPRLREHIDIIRESLSRLLSLDADRISVKAKTAEKCFGELGSGDAVVAAVTVLVED